MRVHAAAWLFCATACSASADDAASATVPVDGSRDTLDKVMVWGRAARLIGQAQSSSEGVVGYADFSTRPMLRVAELTEVVPGMVATAHAGSGKANQYFLRGINLDHGTDFGAFFDGVPINLRSHAHAQGYLDLNFVIPELVRTVEYRKGTHYAEYGDFSAAGAAEFRTYDKLDHGFVQLKVGTEDHARLVAADSSSLGRGTLLYGAEIERGDGPWKLPERQRKYNGLWKYSASGTQFDETLEFTAYTQTWQSTDQIPARAVPVLGRFGFVDPYLGGHSTRLNLSGALQSESLRLSAYVTKYSLNLFSNPTYALDDPVNGDEIEQEDRRWIAGGTARYEHFIDGFAVPLSIVAGADVRYDDIGALNLFHTVARRRIETFSAHRVRESSLDLYTLLEGRWSERFRTTLGLRADGYRYGVDAQIAENSGSGTAGIVSPKFSAAYRFTKTLEAYASYGRGFHSNDVRGVTLRVDPKTGESVQSVPPLVRAEGGELGLRVESGSLFRASLTFFALDLDSELAFAGDAGTSEPKGASSRTGVELSAFVQPWKPLTFDITAAKTHARYRDSSQGGRYIPNAHESVINAGVTLASSSGFVTTLRVRNLGPAPLIEDNSVRERSQTTVNFGASYETASWQVGMEVLNLFDSRVDDVEYFFASRLPNESAPVEDVHFHPAEPREARLEMKYKFK